METAHYFKQVSGIACNDAVGFSSSFGLNHFDALQYG